MRLKTLGTGLLAALTGTAASAQDLEIIGTPVQGNMGFQPAATELARDLQWLDGMILVIITAIVLAVIILFFRRFKITTFDPVMAASMSSSLGLELLFNRAVADMI